MKLSTDSVERKNTPIFSGVLNYFPLSMAYVAKVSKAGNDKHNPGQPLHWARGKSTDHQDCIVRHLIDYDGIDPEDGLLHAGKLAWRALALLETELERRAATIKADPRVRKLAAAYPGVLPLPPFVKEPVPPYPSALDFETPMQFYEAAGDWRAKYGEKPLVRDAGEEVGCKPASDDAKDGADRRDGSK